jgi:hypothetical protein
LGSFFIEERLKTENMFIETFNKKSQLAETIAKLVKLAEKTVEIFNV